MTSKWLLWGWLAVVLTFLCACSDDKEALVQNPDDGPTMTGDRAYITVRFIDVNDAASTRGTAGDYSAGAWYERAIDHADFYFFDETGKYVTAGQTVNIFDGNAETEKDNKNVEWKANVVVALNTLGDGELVKYPKYLLTTLNYSLNESQLAGKTLKDIQSLTTDSLRLQNDNADNEKTTLSQFHLGTDGDVSKLTQNTNPASKNDSAFIMTTSSYDRTTTENGTTTDNNTIGTDKQPGYFVTVLEDTHFVDEGKVTENNFANAVEVFVERLAAKVTVKVDGPDKVQNGSNNDVKYSPTATKADAQSYQVYKLINQNSQKVYFVVEGYKLNGTAKREYLFKNCDFNGWSNGSNPGFTYNPTGTDKDHRCYWTVVPTYNANPANEYPETYGRDATSKYISKATGTTPPTPRNTQIDGWTLYYTNLKDNVVSVGDNYPTYCTEHVEKTDLLSKHVSAATSVLLKGRIVGLQDVSETDKTDNFSAKTYIRYARLLYTEDDFKQKAIDYLYNNGLLNAYKQKTSSNDATVTAESVELITANELKIEGDYDGYVNIKLADNAGTIYKKTDDGSYTAYGTTDSSSPNLQTDVFDKFNEVSYAIGYKDGLMYWNIPIQHMRTLTADEASDWKNSKEGHYGVVRNHWYQITVNKISRLGKGIHDEEELIIPNTAETKLYELGANINILSWKLVTQQVGL